MISSALHKLIYEYVHEMSLVFAVEYSIILILGFVAVRIQAICTYILILKLKQV